MMIDRSLRNEVRTLIIVGFHFDHLILVCMVRLELSINLIGVLLWNISETRWVYVLLLGILVLRERILAILDMSMV